VGDGFAWVCSAAVSWATRGEKGTFGHIQEHERIRQGVRELRSGVQHASLDDHRAVVRAYQRLHLYPGELRDGAQSALLNRTEFQNMPEKPLGNFLAER